MALKDNKRKPASGWQKVLGDNAELDLAEDIIEMDRQLRNWKARTRKRLDSPAKAKPSEQSRRTQNSLRLR